MIGPDDPGSLEFRVSEMLGIRANDPIFQVADAIRSTAGIPMLFVHGEKDDSSSASSLVNVAAEPKTLMVIPGGDHQFSGTGDRFRNNLLQGLD